MKIAEIPVIEDDNWIILEKIADNTYVILDNIVEYNTETEEIDISKIDSSKLLESGWNMPNDVEFACSNDFYENIRINTKHSQLQTIHLILFYTHLISLKNKDYYQITINNLDCLLYKDPNDYIYKFITVKEMDLNNFLYN